MMKGLIDKAKKRLASMSDIELELCFLLVFVLATTALKSL